MRRWLSLKATQFAFWVDPLGFQARLADAFHASNQRLLQTVAKDLASLFPPLDIGLHDADTPSLPDRPTVH